MIPLHGRYWLLGAFAAVLLPQLLRMPPWLALLCALPLAWRAFVDRRGWALPGRALRLLLTAGGLGGVLLAYRTVLGLDAGLALMSVMLSLKLLEMRSPRDAAFMIFFSWFLVAGGFLADQSIAVGVYLLLVVFALTAALIAINHPAGRGHGLYLRRAGVMLAQALPIMLLLFIVFPRLPGPLWGVPENASRARTGMADHMEIGSISDLVDSDEVAFRVQFHGATPPAGALYWRGPVLWQTDGRRWDPLFADTPPRWYARAPELLDAGAPVRYTLTLEPHDERWLFALDLPVGAPDRVRFGADFQMRLPRQASARQRYELEAYLDYRTGALSAAERRAALQLPSGKNPRTRALARSWRALKPEMRVQSALALFREQDFWYTRRPPALGAQAVDDFLFSSRRGFCEHYAAALATLMRAAEVPARVVTGYQGGEHNPFSDYLIVRQARAHAWVEVWLAGSGWTRVDPTAVIPPQRVETEIDAERFRSTAPALLRADLGWLTRSFYRARYGWDAVNNAWNQWVLGYDRAQQERLLQRLGLLHLGWQGVALGALGAIGLLLGLVLLMLLRGVRGRRDELARLYARYGKKLRAVGLVQRPHEGAAAFARRIAAQRPDLAFASAMIADGYNALRYGDAEPQRLAALRARIRAFRPLAPDVRNGRPGEGRQ